MEVVSAGQEKDSAATKISSDIVKCAEEAQVQASAELLADLRQMVNEPAFSDVVFVCNDGKRVQASRRLLAGRSEVLKSMFLNGMAESSLSEIELPEISSTVLLAIFEFLYTGTLLDYQPQSWRIGCELIIASRFFLLPKLQIITRKFMHTQTCAVAQDLPNAASLLTEAVGFKALCDEADANLLELVTTLSSNWSASIYVGSLSEEAFDYLLANSKGNYEDDDRLLFREYLRFRQVIRWWVYQSDFGFRATEALVHFIAPDETEALSICQNPENFERPESPAEDARFWNCFRADEASRNSAIRLLSHIDCRWIHPVLLAKVVEPLKIISAGEILNSYRFHALRRPMIFKTPECGWEHGESYSTHEQGCVIRRTGNKIGLAVMTAAMSRSYGVYKWSLIFEEGCDGHGRVGFIYHASGVGAERPKCDGDRLSHLYRARVLRLQGQEASVNWQGLDERTDWKVLTNTYNTAMKVLFSFDAFERTCSLSIGSIYFGVVWKNLPNEIYHPAVSFGTSSRGRLRIERVSGFDIV